VADGLIVGADEVGWVEGPMETLTSAAFTPLGLIVGFLLEGLLEGLVESLMEEGQREGWAVGGLEGQPLRGAPAKAPGDCTAPAG